MAQPGRSCRAPDARTLAGATHCRGASRRFAFRGSHRAELSLKGTHGYRVTIVERNHRELEVYAGRRHTGAIYRLRGKPIPGDDIEAKLPGVGRIAIEFHPTGKPRTTSGFFPECKGGDTVTRHGFFQGTIRFRGEQGFTTVDETRARGAVVSIAKEVCNGVTTGEEPRDPTEHLTQLHTYSKTDSRAVYFLAYAATFEQDPGRDWTAFLAEATEQRRGMNITRIAIALPKGKQKGEQLSVDDSGAFPLSATVKPVYPFHGTATFQRHPGSSPSWTGPLNVSLPGLGKVRLAGSGFSSRFCQDEDCRKSRRSARVDLPR
jgi:hypothetical protein